MWDDLAAVKNARIEEFEKYDILGAYEISKDAEIYTRGDYVIMVMHQDNDAAKKLLRNTSLHRGSALPRRRGCFCFISTGVCGCGIGKTKIQWFQRNIEIQCASQAAGGNRMYENEIKPQTAVLVAVDTGEYDIDVSLDELEELAATAGAQVIGRMVQKRTDMDVATCIGSGRLAGTGPLLREHPGGHGDL